MPEILTLGPLTIRGYGLMIGIGIVLCFWVVIHEARRTGLRVLEDRIVILFFTVAGSSFIGGKLMFLLVYPQVYDRLKNQGGLLGQGFVYYGALILAVPVTVLVLRRWSVPVMRCIDVLMPLVPVAHGMGRLGCFLAGCCYGCRTDSLLAVTFTHGQGLNDVPVHPVQLYEAAGNLLIFLVIWFGPRLRPRFDGHVLLVYLLLYAVLRFVMELFRGDGNPVWLGGGSPHQPGDPPAGLTTAQVTSVLLASLAAVLLWRGLRKGRAATVAPRGPRKH